MNNTKQIPIWVQRLWKIWYGLIAILFIVRFVFLNIADEDTRFFVFAAYLLIAWLPIMFINMYQGVRLHFYLRKHHYQAQRQVLSGFGPIAAIRQISFLRSAEDFGDAEVGRIKQEYKAFLKLAITVFWTMPILFIAFMLGAKIN
ncbi:MAG TPA: hypothetical protein VF627_08100 [Abditibacterium sp.]|jgi:nitrate reductase NapE component